MPTEMPKSKWDELPISDTLRHALAENARLTQHEAKRRHLQFIGKVMRDEDLEALQTCWIYSTLQRSLWPHH